MKKRLNLIFFIVFLIFLVFSFKINEDVNGFKNFFTLNEKSIKEETILTEEKSEEFKSKLKKILVEKQEEIGVNEENYLDLQEKVQKMDNCEEGDNLNCSKHIKELLVFLKMKENWTITYYTPEEYDKILNLVEESLEYHLNIEKLLELNLNMEKSIEEECINLCYELSLLNGKPTTKYTQDKCLIECKNLENFHGEDAVLTYNDETRRIIDEFKDSNTSISK